MTTVARLKRRMKESLRAAIAGGTRLFVKMVPFRVAVILKEHLELTEKLDYDKHDIYLSIHSSIEHAIRVHSCKREPETIGWIERSLRGGDVLFDIGANVGAYSLVAAKFSRGEARIYAFEPAFSSFAALCRNIAINHCDGCIVPLNLVLSDETSIGAFHYSDTRSGSSLHSYGSNRNCKGQLFTPAMKQPVLSYRLDDLVRIFPIPVPNLMKIDVDGIELAILQGAVQTFKDQRLRSVLVEIEPESTHRGEICDFMALHGFRLLPASQQGAANVIFARPMNDA